MGINFAALSGDLNQSSLYVYNKTAAPTPTGFFIGALQIGTAGNAISHENSGQIRSRGPNANTVGSSVIATGGDFRGHIMLNRVDPTLAQLSFHNDNSEFIGNITDASTAEPATEIVVMALNSGNYSDANIAFAFVGQSLTIEQAQSLREAVDSFQSALNLSLIHI